MPYPVKGLFEVYEDIVEILLMLQVFLAEDPEIEHLFCGAPSSETCLICLTFRHLKQGIQDFHRKYVLVPADKAANNVVVV